MSGFSFGNTGGTSANTGFSFGSTPAAGAAPAATFGTPAKTGTTPFGTLGTSTPITGGLGAATATVQPFGSAPLPASAPSFSFSTPAAATTTQPAAGATSTFSFGTPATTSAFPSGGGFGATSSTAPGGAFGATATTFGTPAATGTTFGTPAVATSTFATPIATGTTTFGTPAATGTSFGTTSGTGTAFGASAPSATTFGTGTGTSFGAPAASTAFGTSTTGGFGSGIGFSSTTGLSQPATQPGAQGVMTFEELEAKCNEWKKELDLQEESFLKRATQINAWDRLIITNAEMITNLNEYMKKVKSDQERMDRELDFVVAQQKELEEILLPLEKEATAIEPSSIQHHTDVERETTYNAATTVNAQLRAMSERIKEIIEHINANNKTSNDTSSISQITRVLNAHMDALQFVQNGIGTLQQKTEDVNKLLGTVKI